MVPLQILLGARKGISYVYLPSFSKDLNGGSESRWTPTAVAPCHTSDELNEEFVHRDMRILSTSSFF
jgi:hypothetical protein